MHELGHQLGLRHCQRFSCNMNGSNSLAETDRQPLHLCPDCLRKLQWRLGFDVLQRYDRLEAFLREVGLAEEAEWYRGRAVHVREIGVGNPRRVSRDALAYFSRNRSDSA